MEFHSVEFHAVEFHRVEFHGCVGCGSPPRGIPLCGIPQRGIPRLCVGFLGYCRIGKPRICYFVEDIGKNKLREKLTDNWLSKIPKYFLVVDWCRCDIEDLGLVIMMLHVNVRGLFQEYVRINKAMREIEDKHSFIPIIKNFKSHMTWRLTDITVVHFEPQSWFLTLDSRIQCTKIVFNFI